MNSTSITKALSLLELLAASDEPVPLQDIAEAVKLPKSSVHRFLNCLQELGYVSRPVDGRRYQIGPRAARLATSDFYGPLKAAAHPILRKLHEEFNETVNLGVLSGQQILYVDFVETTHLLRYIITPGLSNPWNSTAMGVAIASRFDEENLERLLAGTKFQAMTPHTIMSLPKLRSRLDEVRAAGLAEEDQESVKGVCCVARSLAGIGFPEAAVSIAIPRERLSPEMRKSMIAFVEGLIPG